MEPPRAAPGLAGAVDRLVAQCRPVDGHDPVRVLDLGGGTGGQALRLVLAGHDVTVVDPSLDALAALGRRASEAGVADRLRGVQGDAEDLARVLADDSVDLVLCHGVLEVVDDPQVALAAIRRVVRDAGRLSLVVAQRSAAVLSRVSAGHVRQAHRIALGPDGRWGDGDLLRRRFDLGQVTALLIATGFRVDAAEGQRVLGDLLPHGSVPPTAGPTTSSSTGGPSGASGASDGDRDVRGLLADLEVWASTQPGFLDVAAQLHVHAVPVADVAPA